MDNPEYSETAVAPIEDLQSQQLQNFPTAGPREGALSQESNIFVSESQAHLTPSTRSHLDNIDKQETLRQLLEITDKRPKDEELQDLASGCQALLSSAHYLLQFSTKERIVISQCAVLFLQHAAGDHQKAILQWLLCLALNYRWDGRLAEVDSALMDASSIEENVSNINTEILDAMIGYVYGCAAENALGDADPWTIKLLLRLKDMYAEQSAFVIQKVNELLDICLDSGSSLDHLLHLRPLYIQALDHKHDFTIQLSSYLAQVYADYDQMDEVENLVSEHAGYSRCTEQAGTAGRCGSLTSPGFGRKFGITHDKTFQAMNELAHIIRDQDRAEAMILDLHMFAAKLRVHSANTLHIWEDFKDLARRYNVDQTALEEHRPEKQPGIKVKDDSSVQLTPHDSRPGSTGHNGGTYISAHSSVEDAFSYLLNQGCSDLTPKVAPSGCTEAALSGGRFGDVWCGRLDSGTEVAIKCLRLHTISDINPKAIKVNIIWIEWSHPNVLELLGFATYQGQLAMISPWMSHGTLCDYVRKYPRLDRWQLCTQVAEGLEYIHSVQMIHGDLKASNILVSEDGLVKLSDFGNSVFVGGLLGFSATNIAGGGTARWMAPELIKQEISEVADRSMAADVYALGMTILEVVTGKLPFYEHRQDAVVTLMVTEGEHPKRPIQLAEGALFGTKRWETMVSCWNFLHQDRPSSMVVHRTMASLS
ncbi:WD repeat-containing protein [Ceratobasidium sp. AG-Ba]|nr:WD repeat-containing protein [Ceratobasidium sp. AG-Ba]